MERTLNFISQHWRFFLICLGALCLAYILLFHRLGSLTPPQYTATELVSQQQSSSLKTILSNPVDAPYKLMIWSGLKLGHHSILVTRITSALCASIAACLFYFVASVWYSRRIAILSSLLFVMSDGFLHFGRYGTGLMLQMASLALVGCILLYQRTRHEMLAAYITTIVVIICLYIPGMIWLELVGAWILRKHIAKAFKHLGNPHKWLLVAYGLILSLPLIWSSVQDVSILRSILGLPESFSSLSSLVNEFAHLVASIIYRGYWPSEYWLHAAPLLTIAEVLLFIAGFILLFSRPILRMNHFLLVALVISTLLVTLRASVSVAILVPLIYLTIAGGLYYLLDQWLTVFPRNPIAKFTGVALISALVVFSAFYHLRAYFVAWPNAPETKAVYTGKFPLIMRHPYTFR